MCSAGACSSVVCKRLRGRRNPGNGRIAESGGG